MTSHPRFRSLSCGLIVALVAAVGAAVALAVTGHQELGWGIGLGAAIGSVMIQGTVLLGAEMVRRAQPTLRSRRRFRLVVTFQVVKYLIAIGALYLLVARTTVDPVGLAVGYGIPLVALVIVGLVGTDGGTKPNSSG